MSFAKETYNNLMELIEKNEAFFFKDFNLHDKTYRIMNYRLASWSLFQEPGAMNCRGIMYDVTDPHNVKLVSLPQKSSSTMKKVVLIIQRESLEIRWSRWMAL